MIAFFFTTLMTISNEAPLGDLGSVVGEWTCTGHFIERRKPLAAMVTAVRDPGTGTLLVRHNDAPPGRYRSLEVWSKSPDGAALRASISDINGMRWFESHGWTGSHLVWDRVEGGHVVERLSYDLQTSEQLQIDWSVARVDKPLALGDTLTCHRVRAG